MKTFSKTYVSFIMFFIFIFLSLPVNSQDDQSSPASEIEKVIEKSSVEENQVDPLLGIAAVASAAIHTADNSVDVMFMIVSSVSVFAALVVIVLGVFGLHSIRQAKKRIREQIDELERDVNRQQEIIAQSSGSMIFITNAMLDWEVAHSLMHKTPRNAAAIKDYLQSANSNWDSVISSARKSGNVTLEAWVYSMKAYIFKRLDDVPEAIKHTNKSISIIEDYMDKNKRNKKNAVLIDKLKNRLPNKFYNLACYYCLEGEKDSCLEYLRKSITGIQRYKEDAKTEEDFKTLWDDDDFKMITN